MNEFIESLAQTMADEMKVRLEKLGYPQPWEDPIEKHDIENVVSDMADEIAMAFGISRDGAIDTMLRDVSDDWFDIND